MQEECRAEIRECRWEMEECRWEMEEIVEDVLNQRAGQPVSTTQVTRRLISVRRKRFGSG